MSDQLVIKSMFRKYQVLFVEDFTVPLREEEGFFIIDSKIYEIYENVLADILSDNQILLITASEEKKTLEGCKGIIETLVERNIRKNHTLIAIGGGIIQDITSFIASILFRGINWSFYPSTLLAQADSCIGSKTSINLGDKKNLLGNFYPPVNIFIDPCFLDTLPKNEIKSGIGEILHFYFYSASSLIGDLVDEYERLLESPKLLVGYIKESLAIKKSVIEVDEFDRGERNKFNFGHTFGHALETMTNYGISHGQAVTIGMDIAIYLSERLGYMDKKTLDSMHKILRKNIPIFEMKEYSLDVYLQALSKDKKNVGNDLVCILASKPGSLHKVQLTFDYKLKEMIAAYFNTLA